MNKTTAITLSRIFPLLILLSLFLIVSYPVIAEDSTSTAAARKEKIQQRIETRKENVTTRIESMKEKMASREAAMKDKLEAFKDKKKAAIAERINTNLNMINKNQTNQMLNALNKMTTLLDKLEARINNNTPDIKDPNLAKTTISDARAAIASASAAVSAQAQKDYTITVTAENRIRLDAKGARTNLHTDLLAARKMVISAKQAVSNAVRAAKSGKIESKEATAGGK